MNTHISAINAYIDVKKKVPCICPQSQSSWYRIIVLKRLFKIWNFLLLYRISFLTYLASSTICADDYKAK